MIELLEAAVVRESPSLPIKDGPLPAGMKPECRHCGVRKDSDIYIYKGRVLCGDCRYKVRTGKWPSYGKGTSSSAVAYQYESNPWQENAVRCLEDSIE